MSASPLAAVVVLALGKLDQELSPCFLMAKAGAEVIRAARTSAAVDLGSLLPVEILNADKGAISIDLMTPRGHDLRIRLECRADVPIEQNFAPNAMNRRGVGWRVLNAADPRPFYGNDWSFGVTGRDRDGLAMDY